VYGMHRNQSRAQQSQSPQTFERAHAETGLAFADLVQSLVNMDVHGGLQLLRVYDDLLEAAIAHGIWGVWGDTKGQRIPAFELVAYRQPLAQVVLRVRGIGRGELDADQTDRRAHSRS